MPCRRWLVGLCGLLLLACLAPAQGDSSPFLPPRPAQSGPVGLPHIPLELLPATHRRNVEAVLERPTLTARGVPETFNAEAPIYRWLLEHPEVGVRLWRLLGAKVADITQSKGVYTWTDGQGSEVLWQIVHRGEGIHVWLAEGKIKPALLLPTSSFRALAVLQYTTGQDTHGKAAIRHQVHFLLRCDSRAMALAARILGASAPHLAEQYLGQLQMFYGGMAWYLSQDEQRARKMLRDVGVVVPQTAAAPGERGASTP
jgi:hypothetical protein